MANHQVNLCQPMISSSPCLMFARGDGRRVDAVTAHAFSLVIQQDVSFFRSRISAVAASDQCRPNLKCNKHQIHAEIVYRVICTVEERSSCSDCEHLRNAPICEFIVTSSPLAIQRHVRQLRGVKFRLSRLTDYVTPTRTCRCFAAIRRTHNACAIKIISRRLIRIEFSCDNNLCSNASYSSYSVLF